MKDREYFFQLETLYNQVPPTTCLNCGKCCLTARVGCYAVEYQFIKQYIEKYLSSKQKELIEKRILRNRFMETVYFQKKEIIPRLPCVLLDGQHKKCLIYPARPFLCRMNGLKGDEGSCENVKISNGQYFDIKHKKKFLERLKNISRSYAPEYGKSLTNYDFLRNWIYQERFGADSRLPLKKDKQFYGVNFDEFIGI